MNTNQSNKSSLLETDIEIVGDISFQGELYLQGKVSGNVVAPTESNAALYLQESSHVTGEIRAPQLVVAGKVSGDIFVSRRVVVKATAEIAGNIHYSEIQVEGGASIDGALMALGKPTK